MDYIVYVLEDGQFVQEAFVNSFSTGVETNWVNTGIRVDSIDTPKVYIILPAATPLPGPTEKMIDGTEATVCDPTNIQDATLGDVAILTGIRPGSQIGTCRTDGQYNAQGYLVKKGKVHSSDNSEYIAYSVDPPTTPPTQFLDVPTRLFVLNQEMGGELYVYRLQGAGIEKQATLVWSTGHIDTSIRVDNLESTAVFVVTRYDVSSWPWISQTVKGAEVAMALPFRVTARQFMVEGTPFVPYLGPGKGPGSRTFLHGIPKKFFQGTRSDGKEGVVWQDVATGQVYLTWIAVDMASADTMMLQGDVNWQLASAVFDGEDKLITLLVSRNELGPNMLVEVRVDLIRCSDGVTIHSRQVNGAPPGLDVQKASPSGASMVWNTQSGKVGILLSRHITALDGKTRQGAIAVVMDADTLEVTNLGPTASRSYSNSIVLTEDGRFLGVDLGDREPRGILLTKFDTEPQIKEEMLVYTFKTKHATTGNNSFGDWFDPYDEVSSVGQQYYKWSPVDGNVYTELGHSGVVETSDGYLVLFSGERPPLDNSRVGKTMNDPRNVAAVRVTKTLSDNVVLSGHLDEIETGGFYDRVGTWIPLQNRGIEFLTNYMSMDSSVSRLKTAVVGDEKILLYWELWSETEYQSTQLAVLDSTTMQLEPVNLGYDMVLPIQDDLRPAFSGNRTVAYAGTSDGNLIRYEICAGCETRRRSR